MEVLDISFDEVAGVFQPNDIYDFTEVVTVNVGENGKGNYFYFTLVTNQSISKLRDKRSIFMLEVWESVESLITQLNNFIKAKLEENPQQDPFECLSKYWQWEYDGYNS